MESLPLIGSLIHVKFKIAQSLVKYEEVSCHGVDAALRIRSTPQLLTLTEFPSSGKK